MSKPRIYKSKYSDDWFCHAFARGMVGIGLTPQEAYNNWLKFK